MQVDSEERFRFSCRFSHFHRFIVEDFNIRVSFEELLKKRIYADYLKRWYSGEFPRNWKCVSDVHVLLVAERPVFCEDSSSCQISIVKVKHCGFNYVEMMPDTSPSVPLPPAGPCHCLCVLIIMMRASPLFWWLTYSVTGLRRQMILQGFHPSLRVQVQQQPFIAPTPPNVQDGTVDRRVPCKSITREPVSHALVRFEGQRT